MIKPALIFGFVTLLASSVSAQSPAPTITSTVALLAVAKPLSASSQSAFESYHAGTRISLMVAMPNNTIKGIDRKASRLLAITDDRGKDLTKSIRNSKGEINLAESVHGNITSDGHEMDVNLQTNDLPTPGSSTIKLKARLVVEYGTAIKQVTLTNVPLTVGSLIKIGPINLKLNDIQQTSSNTPWTYSFSSDQDLRKIAKLDFTRADGSPCGQYEIVGEEFNGSDGIEFSMSYGFVKKQTSVNIKATYYDAIKPAVLDVNTEIGLSL